MHPKELPFLVVSDVLGHLMPTPRCAWPGAAAMTSSKPASKTASRCRPAASSSVCPNAWPSAWMQRAATCCPVHEGPEGQEGLARRRLSGARPYRHPDAGLCQPREERPQAAPSSPTPPWAGWTAQYWACGVRVDDDRARTPCSSTIRPSRRSSTSVWQPAVATACWSTSAIVPWSTNVRRPERLPGALRAAPAQLAHLQRGLRWLPQFSAAEAGFPSTQNRLSFHAHARRDRSPGGAPSDAQ